MAEKKGLKVWGEDVFKKNVKKLLDVDFRLALEKTVNESGLLIVARAKQNLQGKYAPTPYRHWITGNLSRSIKCATEWKSATVLETRIGTAVHYAPYIEALPDGGYLMPALNVMWPDVTRKTYEDIRRMFKTKWS
jgi:hypothetical protein